jgi:hypothetical protein
VIEEHANATPPMKSAAAPSCLIIAAAPPFPLIAATTPSLVKSVTPHPLPGNSFNNEFMELHIQKVYNLHYNTYIIFT